jgi:hypothetical protein
MVDSLAEAVTTKGLDPTNAEAMTTYLKEIGYVSSEMGAHFGEVSA